jgi:ABC-type siderophore export system fused ATPase/permease subunit
VTLLRRLLRGERFWEAHREHYYQRLIRMGWSHRRTAWVYYALMLTTGLTAYSTLFLSAPLFILIVVLVVLGIVVSLMRVVDRLWSAKLKTENDA